MFMWRLAFNTTTTATTSWIKLRTTILCAHICQYHFVDGSRMFASSSQTDMSPLFKTFIIIMSWNRCVKVKIFKGRICSQLALPLTAEAKAKWKVFKKKVMFLPLVWRRSYWLPRATFLWASSLWFVSRAPPWVAPLQRTHFCCLSLSHESPRRISCDHPL